jgi:hypothetical protein
VFYGFPNLPLCFFYFCRYLAIGSSKGDISISDIGNFSEVEFVCRYDVCHIYGVLPSSQGIFFSISSEYVTLVEPDRSGSRQGSLFYSFLLVC